jgi:hypothetical protein
LWDGTSWSALGAGVDAPVRALAVDGVGNLYVGGDFGTAGGVSASCIARWNGTSWSALGAGMNSPVAALAVDAAGNLYAGGFFTSAGGVGANYIAKWNGTSWSALGAGMDTGGAVNALVLEGGGSLYAGGSFSTAGRGIAKWNGTTWSALGSGVDLWVNALAMAGEEDLYVGGVFTNAGGKSSHHFGIWHGNTTVGVPPGTVPAVPPALAWPNPFTNQVSIVFNLPAAMPVRMEVFDVTGRRVWASALTFLGPGRQCLVWDGRGTDGDGPATAGTYLVRVRGPGITASRTVVRVK